jgi:hypothetical protein
VSDNQLAVEVVRGEMQPWTDYDGKRGAVQGPVLAALLDDVLPTGARTLVLGPHAADLVSVVITKASETTMLVRSVSDAAVLAEEFGDRLQVIAGALDGLAGQAFDVVVAADGLDRVLSYDSDGLNWSQRLDVLAAVAAPGPVMVLGLENEFSLTNLLDQRPADQRHGDDEWRPLHDDPSRPVSVVQLASELERVGLGARTAYAAFSDRALLAVDVAAAARPGQLPALLAVEALEASDVPLLAPVFEGADSAARAGLLGSTSSGWVAVTAPSRHAIYAKSGPSVLTADASADGWSVAVSPGTAGDGEVVFDASVVPNVVPAGVSVETLLFRLAAAEDVPGFRALAARLGQWAQASRVVLRWDDVVVDGDSFAYGVSPWVTVGDETKADLLAAAWQRFHDRLIGAHRRHPWPPWMVGDDLVSAWLGMSGVASPAAVAATAPEMAPASSAQVARGKELAAAVGTVLEAAGAAQTPDVRTALAEAERAKRESFELAGQIFGLERTLGFRDKALKTRETRVREMRLEVQKANAERARFRNSRAFVAATLIRRAATIRNPRAFAFKLKRRAKRTLRKRFG